MGLAAQQDGFLGYIVDCWTELVLQHSNLKSSSTWQGCSVALYVGMNSVSFEQTVFTFKFSVEKFKFLNITLFFFLYNVGKKTHLLFKKATNLTSMWKWSAWVSLFNQF